MSTNMFVLALFLVGPVLLFYTLSLYESFGSNFVVCDLSLQVLTKRSDRFDTTKLYRILVFRKIDFAKYPVVFNLLRHKTNTFGTK